MESTKTQKKSPVLLWVCFVLFALAVIALAVLPPNAFAWVIGAILLLAEGFLFISYKSKNEAIEKGEDSMEFWKKEYTKLVSEKSSLLNDNANLEHNCKVLNSTIESLRKELEAVKEPVIVEIPADETPEVLDTEEVIEEPEEVTVEEVVEPAVEPKAAPKKKTAKRAKK